MRAATSAGSASQIGLVEDLHLDVPGVARLGDQPGDRGEVDVPVAHHPPREQGVGRERGDPVADLVARDPTAPACPADLVVELRVPPDVEGVDDDADGRGGELLGDVERLPQRRDHAPVGGVDRVHRLDRQHDPGGGGVVDERADGVAGAGPGTGEVPVARQPARDEHQHGRRPGSARRAERRGLLDGPAVLGERGPAARVVGRGEEPAAAQRRHPQPGVGDHAGGGGEPGFGHRLPPQPDARDARFGGDAQRGGQVGVLDRGLVQRQPRVHAGTTPCRAR